MRLRKLEKKQNTKPERSWLDIRINHSGTNQQSEAAKISQKKKNKNKN